MSSTTDKIVLIKESKTWEEALKHCKRYQYDLVSITNPDQQRLVQVRAEKAETDYVWMGLRYTCVLDLWFWDSDNLVCYENWASGGKSDRCDESGAMDKKGPHEWFGRSKDEELNFICALRKSG